MLSDVRKYIIPMIPGSVPDSREQVAILNAEFGPLPKVYTDLLLEYRPFRFDGAATLLGGSIEDLIVFACYGTGGDPTIRDLHSSLSDICGARWVPFADDEFGDIYAIQRTDESIWFFDIEAGFTPTQVFPSMQAFLDAIIVEPD